MKLLHTSDWHLGRQLHGVSLLEDQRYVLDLQSSGITVGVISHVGELKERMDTRVDLSTSQQGSRVEIVTP